MFDGFFDSISTEIVCLINILLSVLLGFAIGFERKHRSKEAGIRTHTVVCLGSALIMVISKYGFMDLEGVNSDPARIAAQIVTGIGFLGAGMIVYKKRSVHGLTTAAGIWAASGIGMACGAGLYVIAVGSTVLLIGAQCFFNSGLKFLKHKRSYELKITFLNTDNEHEKVKDIFNIEHFKKVVITQREEGLVYVVTLSTDHEFRSESLCQILKENKFILSAERCDEE